MPKSSSLEDVVRVRQRTGQYTIYRKVELVESEAQNAHGTPQNGIPSWTIHRPQRFVALHKGLYLFICCASSPGKASNKFFPTLPGSACLVSKRMVSTVQLQLAYGAHVFSFAYGICTVL